MCLKKRLQRRGKLLLFSSRGLFECHLWGLHLRTWGPVMEMQNDIFFVLVKILVAEFCINKQEIADGEEVHELAYHIKNFYFFLMQSVAHESHFRRQGCLATAESVPAHAYSLAHIHRPLVKEKKDQIMCWREALQKPPSHGHQIKWNEKWQNVFAFTDKRWENPFLNGSSMTKKKKIVRALSNKNDSVSISFWHYQHAICFLEHESGILAPLIFVTLLWHQKPIFKHSRLKKAVCVQRLDYSKWCYGLVLV